MSKSPAQIVKEKFGEKKKLVEAVQQFVNQDLWVGRENEDKGLARVSNAKLLRLLGTFTAVQAKWGTRAKLIDAVVEAANRTKDAGYRTSIANWPVPRLFDAYKSLTKQSAPKEKAAAKKPAAKAEAKPAAKAEAKPAAKKPAAKK
ncbi:MAG: hypothetical protein ACXVEE_11310 [Polyangiales bacterium]